MNQPLPTPQMQPPPQQKIPATGFRHSLISIQQTLVKNKTLSGFLALTFFLSLSTSAYVLVAPAKKAPVEQHFLPATQSNPTATPTPLPTNTPTPVPPTETEIPILPTETPTPTATPSPTPDPTANWNTYVNTAYGYTIRYPLDWNALNLGALEPKVPSYIVFNPNTATTSARSITISVSTRSAEEQRTIGGVTASTRIVANVKGTEQHLKNSDGDKSVAVILPRTSDILIFYTKPANITIFDQMLSTLKLSN